MKLTEENRKKMLMQRGKELAFLLRHDEEAFRMGVIDEHGWRSLADLRMEHHFLPSIVKEIVETDDKQRYEMSKDGKRIRARQGHSIPVDVELKEATPPDVLYHGTKEHLFFGPIMKDGLKPMKRLYVHLSKDVETATKVGNRRKGNLYIIKIDAKQMTEDGCKFWLSNNGVWLTEKVEPKYFIYE